MKKLKNVRLLIWLALPAVLWLLARALPLEEAGEILKRLEPIQIAGLAAFNALAMAFFSSRWWLALRALGYHVPYFELLRYRMAAFAIGYFTPGTQFGGEPLQVYLLEKRLHIPRATALASVTTDKLFELLANFSFLAIGASLLLQQSRLAEASAFQAMLWTGALLALPLAYLGALLMGRLPISSLVRQLPKRISRKSWLCQLEELAYDAERQVSVLLRSKPLAIFSILLSSALIWCLSLAEYWLALRLFGASLNPEETVAALTAARLAFLTPLPGGLGALEAGQALALQALGYSAALGVAISLWIRARDFALGAIGALLGAHLVRSAKGIPLPSQAGD